MSIIRTTTSIPQVSRPGEILYQFPWKETEIGEVTQWPESLRNHVSLIAASRFPMMILWGPNLIQLYNEACRPLFGEITPENDPMGQPAEKYYRETWAYIAPLLKKVQTKGQSVWQENAPLPIYRNGKINTAYWTFSLSPIRNLEDNIEGIFIVCTETTGEVEAGLAARETENKFQTLANHIPNLAWMANAKGEIYWFNQRWYEYTGSNPDMMQQEGWTQMHDPDILPQVLEKWNHSLHTGRPFEMIFPLKGADGQFRQFLTLVQPLKDEEGDIQGWFGSNTDVTAQITANQELLESQKRFRALTQSRNIFIAESDENSRPVYFNEAWETFTGRNQQELIESGWADLIHPDDKEAFIANYFHCFDTQTEFSMEFRMQNSRGEYRWMLSQGPPRFRPDGSFAGFIGTTLDITARKENEKMAADNVARIRNIISGSPYPIGIYTGREMKIEFANKALLNIWGRTEEEAIGKTYSQLLPELSGQDVFRQLDEVYTTGIPYHARNRQINLVINGALHPYYFNYSFTPLTDQEGRIYGVMNSGAETTDLNRILEQLASSESNLRNTILQSPVAMCILKGPEFKLELANERMYEIWGRGPDVLMNRPIFEGLTEAAEQGFEEILTEVYHTGNPFLAHGISVQLPRNGKPETVYLNATYAPYYGEENKITGIIAVGIDVTAQIVAHQKIEAVVAERTAELAVANKNLLRSNEELAQFAYIASHDLQEPLRKISTFGKMLQMRIAGEIDDASAGYLDKIIKSAGRMSNLIRDVLSYSELDSALKAMAPVNLNKILSQVLSELDLLIEEKDAQIISDELPEIEAIPQQMAQLFSNLIGNSLKFSRAGIPPVIKIRLAEESSEATDNGASVYTHIILEDNGIGFKEEYANQIFNVFQRLHRRTEYEGTGIGLAMCKKITLNHGGDLNAEGSSEKGAVFHLKLPYKQTDLKIAAT